MDPDPADAPTDLSTLHVFLAAGQSNMSGRGRPVCGPTSPRVLQYGATRRVLEPATVPLDMHDAASGTSPATFFADRYLRSQPPHVGVLLVPAARGGTGFAGTPTNPAPSWTWTTGAASSAEFALQEFSVTQTREAIAAAHTAGYTATLMGVLWHQGESNSGDMYAAQLDALIEQYRTDFNDPALAFLVGQMSPERTDTVREAEVIDEAHRTTPGRVPGTGFAPATRGGHNDGDVVHFSTAGASYLGDSYLTAYRQAQGNIRRD